jgi:hypothetical protein
MPRKRKQDIKVNNVDSLEGLMQELYNDACVQLSDVQSSINNLNSSFISEDTDENVENMTKIAREKANYFKVKDSAIKIKLDLAKLQSDIIKNRGDVDATLQERNNEKASSTDFEFIRDMLKKNKETIKE